jgi:cyclic pyranopterin phosphate synthase
MNKLSHLDEQGQAKMVDVSGKNETLRRAVATGRVLMRPETAALIAHGGMPKGDVLAAARLAAILAAKKTGELIPLCHPLNLTSVDIAFDLQPGKGEIGIEASVKCVGKTGVEMEALTAVSVAALTIYDMCKAVEKGITITDIRLTQKEGGKSDFTCD